MPSRYILDSNVLIRYPQVLSRAKTRLIVIPRAVLDELSQRRPHGVGSDIADLVAASASLGVQIVDTPEKPPYEIARSTGFFKKLGGADFDLAGIAIAYAEKHGIDAPCVVTDDKALMAFLSTQNIQSISGSDFLELSKGDSINEAIQTGAEKVVYLQRRHVAASFILGGLAAGIGNVIYTNFALLVSTITVWGTMLGLPALGFALFFYRQRFRLSYGIFEFFIGTVMSCYTLFPNFNYERLGVAESIQILGGLYVMVRGLDNIGKGLEGTRLETYWNKIF